MEERAVVLYRKGDKCVGVWVEERGEEADGLG